MLHHNVKWIHPFLSFRTLGFFRRTSLPAKESLLQHGFFCTFHLLTSRLTEHFSTTNTSIWLHHFIICFIGNCIKIYNPSGQSLVIPTLQSSLFSLRYTWKTRWIPVIKLNVFSFFPKVHSPEKPETASVETDWTTWFVLIRRPGHVIVIIVIMDLHWHETSAPAFKDQTSCCFKQQSGFTTHPGLLQCTRNF